MHCDVYSGRQEEIEGGGTFFISLSDIFFFFFVSLNICGGVLVVRQTRVPRRKEEGELWVKTVEYA